MSAVPAAIDALVSVFTAVAPAGCTVIDGDPRDPGRKFLCVAWDESDNAVVEQSATPTNMALAGDGREDFTVTNLLTVWAGDRTTAQVRTELFDLFGVFSASLAADFSLGGAVERALITSLEYVPAVRVEGRLGQIRFTVSVVALS